MWQCNALLYCSFQPQQAISGELIDHQAPAAWHSCPLLQLKVLAAYILTWHPEYGAGALQSMHAHVAVDAYQDLPQLLAAQQVPAPRYSLEALLLHPAR